MEMPGRTGMMDRYRFGFNGKENDREWGTAGLTQDYGMRLYNPAVGRFLSVDPLTQSYPWNSTYAFAEGDVMRSIDLDGAEKLITNEDGRIIIVPTSDRSNVPFIEKYQPVIKPQATISEWIPDFWDKFSKSAEDNFFVGIAYTALDDPYVTATGYHLQGAPATKSERTDAGIGVMGELLPTAKAFEVAEKFAKRPKWYQRIWRSIWRGNPCGCFTAGTLVLTSEGHKKISKIEVGNLVWAWDEETDEMTWKKVTRLFQYARNHIYKIYVGEEIIEATADHPFWIAGKWRNVKELIVGDSVILYSGEKLPITKIEQVQGEFKVYNFEVEDFHTYYISDINILVHNSNPCWKITQKEFDNLTFDAATGTSSPKNVEELKQMQAAINDGFFSGKKLSRPTTEQGADFIVDGIEVDTKRLSDDLLKRRKLLGLKGKVNQQGVHLVLDPSHVNASEQAKILNQIKGAGVDMSKVHVINPSSKPTIQVGSKTY